MSPIGLLILGLGIIALIIFAVLTIYDITKKRSLNWINWLLLGVAILLIIIGIIVNITHKSQT
jgi:FtsH-binding integral membrane protein